jgi:hypothetical protein
MEQLSKLTKPGGKVKKIRPPAFAGAGSENSENTEKDSIR